MVVRRCRERKIDKRGRKRWTVSTKRNNLFGSLGFYVPLEKFHSYEDVTITLKGLYSALTAIEQ